MNKSPSIPRLLIVDDLFGRRVPDGRNEDRANLCRQYLLEDLTGDEKSDGSGPKLKRRVAQAVFCRGQIPACSRVGDVVENDLQGTLEVIRSGWLPTRSDPRWSMILLDLCFYTGLVTQESNAKDPGVPEGRDGDAVPKRYFGLRVLEAIHREFPDLPVVILSSKPREEVSRDFSQFGALAFLPRTEEGRPGHERLNELIDRHGLIPDDAGEIIGRSRNLLVAMRAGRRASENAMHVLIRGERGTGKELLARYIHRKGLKNRCGPFEVVDSGRLTRELYASELFGHEKGAFTDARSKRVGSIVKADGGSLFLDEIGNMPRDIQAGLLRVLEYREVVPLGGARGLRADLRVISATNEDIEFKAAGGGFRWDLLDRLRENRTILLPPLRERKEDIPALTEYFVAQALEKNPKARTEEIAPEALDKLMAHDWPDNVRGLRNCIFNAVNTADVETLSAFHIQLPGKPEPTTVTVPEAVMTPEPEVPPRPIHTASEGLDTFIETIDSFDFETITTAGLSGRLPTLQGAYARLVAKYLIAVLSATSKPTPKDPEGEIFIHPAIKLMTGNDKVTASKAADIIKRLMRIAPEAVEPLLSNPILKEAYETALRLRPKK